MDRILKKIEKKFEENPDLREEFKSIVDRLEEMFEAPLEINLIDTQDMDKYRENFENYNEDEFNSNPEPEQMTLKEFISVITKEDGDLKLSIDPLFLKKGINKINNLMITTFDEEDNDDVILVPMIKTEENE